MSKQRLNLKTVSTLAAGITVPNYDRSAVTAGIVHLGIGAFHRAHMAVYVDDLLSKDPSWGIVGASLRRPDTKDALEPQDGLYTIAVRDASGTHPRVIGSILKVMDANTERDALLDLMASPEVRIVSLTVTEKGYCYEPSTGDLDLNHADIQHDLSNPSVPKSAPGMLVEALARRKAAGIAPFTVMSCDNLPNNGQTAKRIVTAFAAKRDAELGEWVKGVAFPSTMVDRIVPSTTDADREEVARLIGAEDAWPIMTEPFTQWVIENNFPSGRPAFEEVGAQLVQDVEPFEHMKLRMLNGSHSTMAYAGYLGGYEYIAEVVGDEDYRELVHGLMTEEVIPTLDMPGVDLEAYRDQLLARFANPALKHRTWQIAMDGSQKLPQRLLGTIRDRLAAGQSIDRLALGVAAWMRYVMAIDEEGNEIDVRDPLALKLLAIAADAGEDPEAYFNGLVSIQSIFGTDLIDNEVFRNAVLEQLWSFWQNGAHETVANYQLSAQE
ncbi:mannitol dehydrogenase family protein [Devosia sp. MC521]|uniref:mannitol dehydrogenase family protein n=1 Tax=Devosia sp. MC521 TaxID=2759954 RepID=UPI0015F8570A|nr:mannitol dehydrogenase family protein [Devosia sp. MC521]MBJ6986729.1 mannitol dehydrogenase family protein [Devosia sp. MC521]QMW61761.1 mannitol dehydrogenase family protein [Devosia sp. MC521]